MCRIFTLKDFRLQTSKLLIKYFTEVYLLIWTNVRFEVLFSHQEVIECEPHKQIDNE